MGKLFNLKEWLTVADAARHLSIIFGEDVTEAEVLRLALDGHLKLSVDFVNHASAKRMRVIPIGEARAVPSLDGKDTVLLGIVLNEHEILDRAEGPIITLTGVWDLTMIGGESLAVERLYHVMTNGPKVTLINIDGAYVANPDGEIYELQADFCDYEDTKEEYKSLNRNDPDRYHSGDLPADSVFVIRTDALRKFEQSINGGSATTDKPITTTERNTLLTIIAALCDYSAIKPDDRGAANQIVKLTEEIGATVSDDTVRRWLKAIPDALATRMK
jgi:hypothetical protein